MIHVLVREAWKKYRKNRLEGKVQRDALALLIEEYELQKAQLKEVARLIEKQKGVVSKWS